MSDFDRAVQEHDEAVARTGLEIWVGAEPTFTDRASTDPAWLVEALGADKEARARALLADLRDNLVRGALHPNFAPLAEVFDGQAPDPLARGLVLRSVGRKYPGEKLPRWSYGLYCLRDGAPLWTGPRDPIEAQEPGSEATGRPQRAADGAGVRGAAPAYEVGAVALMLQGTSMDIEELVPAGRGAAVDAQAKAIGAQLRDALLASLVESGRVAKALDAEGEPAWRVAFRLDGGAIDAGDARLGRPSCHGDGAVMPCDALAGEGLFLVCVGVEDGVARIELPALPDVSTFIALLQDMAVAARRIGATQLVIAGHPPPVNPSAAWTTVTPDPGVIEVNMAPAPNVSTFLKLLRDLYGTAARHGLSPLRWWFNGDVADSGGGGHLTLGGPTPAGSPFFVRPRLLPGLVSYLNHHPSLSYLFAVDSLGSSSQSPRPDEGVRESFEELAVALSLLSRLSAPEPEQIWAGLAPFLADRFGNVHRSEVNVEKLWNPYLAGRGKWGVVELRALRMPPTPERAAAQAALFRSIVAMLGQTGEVMPLVDWGSMLHDRYALPFFLERDLEAVLAELDTHGVGLPEALAAELRDDGHRLVGRATLGGVEVSVRRAIEFWPLVGDLSAQDARTARLIDSSTARIEVLVRPAAGTGEAELARWRLAVDGVAAPLPLEYDAAGAALVMGLRLRAFVPTPGLHPTLGKQLPLALVFHADGAEDATCITLHDWIPGGGTYSGLPADPGEARRRRDERFVVESVAAPQTAPRAAPREALTPHTLDLRRI